MDGNTDFEKLLAEARALNQHAARSKPDAQVLAAIARDPQFIEPLEKIGSGGMGCVYRTRRGESQRVIAVKIPRSRQDDSEQAQISRLAFWRECFAQASLSHPGIVPLFEFGSCSETDLQPFLIMQFVEANSWRAYIRDAQERLSASESQSELLRLVIELSKVVEHAHEQGVRHRDLKPENVKVRPDGHVYVMDWGLAQGPFDELFRKSRFVAEVPEHLLDRVVSPQPGQGTLWYRAPEQGEGLPADERSDVFACGRLLMQAFGVPEGEDAELDEAALRAMPTAVRAIAETACADDPAQRYGSAREFREELDRVLAGYVAKAQKASVGVRLGAWWRRHQPVPTVAAAALVTIGGVWSVAQSQVVEANEQQSIAQSQVVKANEQQAVTLAAAVDSLNDLLQTLPPQQLLGMVQELLRTCPEHDVVSRARLLELEAKLQLLVGDEDRARKIRTALVKIQPALPRSVDEVQALRDEAEQRILHGDVAEPRQTWIDYIEAHAMLEKCYEKHSDHASLRDDLIWSFIRLSNPSRWRDPLHGPFSNIDFAVLRLERAHELAQLGLEQHPDERVSLHSMLQVLTRLGNLRVDRRNEIRPRLESHLARYYALPNLDHTQLRNASNAWYHMARWACDAGDHEQMLDTYSLGLPMIRRAFLVIGSEPCGAMLLEALQEVVKLSGLHDLPLGQVTQRELEEVAAIARERGWAPSPTAPAGASDFEESKNGR